MAETKTNWIWMRNWTAEDKEEAALVLFQMFIRDRW